MIEYPSNPHGISLPGWQNIEYTLYLPLNFNNGRSVQPKLFRKAQSEFLAFAGGLTQRYPGYGYWVNRAARVYRDVVIPFQIVVPPTATNAAWINYLAAQSATMFEQEEIFVFSQPVWRLEANQPPIHLLSRRLLASIQQDEKLVAGRRR